jgi:biotin operon repressor
MRKTKHGTLEGALMVTGEQLQEKLNCGYKTAKKIACASGAQIFVGRRVWYNIKKIEEYLEKVAI